MSKKSKEPPQRLFLLNTPEQVEAWYDGTLPGLYERDPDEFKKPYKKFGGKLEPREAFREAAKRDAPLPDHRPFPPKPTAPRSHR